MAKGKDSRPRIGFVGMGHMGSRMASRLIDAGYPMTVYNRTIEKTRPLAERGADVAINLLELAESSDVIMSSLTNDSAVKSTMLGPEGVFNRARAGSILIDLSTVYPATSRQVFDAARGREVRMIDAAVSGSTPQAEQGTLIIMVGGGEDTYQECKPILDVLGKESFYMGPSGMGTTMGLVVNTLLGLGLQALAEAIVLGEKAGLQKDRLLDVLSQTAVISPGQKSKLENVRREEYPVTFALRLMYKDFGLILRQAVELTVPMPATAVAQQMCAVEQAKQIEEDCAAVIRTMEELAGLLHR